MKRALSLLAVMALVVLAVGALCRLVESDRDSADVVTPGGER